jgi:1,4-alpha-glucan branching enzyme
MHSPRPLSVARQEVAMLRKEKAAGGKVKVTFSMPALEGVTALFLVGSFNDWRDTATPLVRGADGGWSVALTLEAGWAYQYRFRDQDGGWHNDWAADAYVPNEFSSENSVADLTDAEAGPASPRALDDAASPAAGPAAAPAAKKPDRKPAARPSAPRGKKKP